jgi:FKBP-type peptidyl-prolyl cis-trans isomerase FkpA
MNPASGETNPEAAYALGMMTARGLAQLQLSPSELGEFERGMQDYLAGKPRVLLLGELGKIQVFQTQRMGDALEHARVSGDELLRSAALESGAEQLESGIVFRSLAAGEGATPKSGERAVVRAEGSLPDGTVFLSSQHTNKPIVVDMSTGIPCLTESLARMSVGGRARVTCPPQTGYSEADRPLLVLPGAALRYELELVDVKPNGADVHR